MLLLASSVCGLFKWRQFAPEVILLAVGWYLRFSLSYRDVEELLAERGLRTDHVTVWRWVQRYGPWGSRNSCPSTFHLPPCTESKCPGSHGQSTFGGSRWGTSAWAIAESGSD